MSSSLTVYLKGDIIEENVTFSLHDLSHASGATEEQLRLWVLEGILDLTSSCRPTQETMSNWRFPGTALKKAMVAHRLMDELNINIPGVALALDLLEQLEQLQQKHF